MDFTSLMGINKALAEVLKKKNIKTKEQLLAIIDQLPLSTQLDLKYPVTKKIPREVIRALKDKVSRVFAVEFLGSFRRELPFCSDIDILVPKKISKETFFKKTSKIFDCIGIYMNGEERVSFLMEFEGGYYFTDVLFATPDEWYFSLLYFTGSKQFNIMMRGIAKKKAFLLNQKGLFKAGKKIKVNSEKEIFDKLGMQYVEPRDRK